MANDPILDPDAVRNALALQRLPAPAMLPSPSMPLGNPLANTPAPASPSVSLRPPTSQDITSSRLLGDQTELQRLSSSGDGISQIKSKPLHVLARIGDVAESILAPGAAAFTPGTSLNHQRLLKQQEGLVNNDLANQQSQAQTTLLDAQPQLKMMGLENAQLRNQAYSQHVSDQGEHYDNQDTSHLRNTGFTLDETDPTGQKLRPLRYEEMSGIQQATEDLKHAQTEQAEAAAAMKKAQNDPTSPAFKLAKQRADSAQFTANTARQRLGLSQAQYNMHAYGTDASGQNELPGILHDEAGRGVGSVQASNVRPTTMSRDAASRADSMVDIGNRIRAGLADPEIQSYLGAIRGRVSDAQGTAGLLPENVAKFRNDLVSYGAFQAGLHPVRGIGALQYFEHVMGGLGQTPESLLGKLNSNDETAAAVQKVGAMPTSAGIARSETAPHGPPNRGGAQVFKDGNTTYHIPANQVGEFKKDHPNAR